MSFRVPKTRSYIDLACDRKILLKALGTAERGLLAALDALENERLSAQYVTPKKRQSADSKSMSMELDHVAMESEKEARAALEEVRSAIRAATGGTDA